jgi:hypothetical protein
MTKPTGNTISHFFERVSSGLVSSWLGNNNTQSQLCGALFGFLAFPFPEEDI